MTDETEAVLQDLRQQLESRQRERSQEQALRESPVQEAEDMARHGAMASVASCDATLIRRDVERNGISQPHAEVLLHRLGNHHVELEEALRIAEERPDDVRQSPESIAERQALRDAIADLEDARSDIGESLDAASQAPENVRIFKQAEQRAAAPYEADVQRADALRAHITEGTFDPEKRIETKHQLDQVTAHLEHAIVHLVHESWEPTAEEDDERVAAHEALARALADVQSTIYAVNRASTEQHSPAPAELPSAADTLAMESISPVSEPPSFETPVASSKPERREKQQPLWERVRETVRTIEGLLTEGMTSLDMETRDRLLLQLSQEYAQLDERQKDLLMGPEKRRQRKDATSPQREREEIAEMLGLIEDIRHRLHDLMLSPEKRNVKKWERPERSESDRLNAIKKEQSRLEARIAKEHPGMSARKLAQEPAEVASAHVRHAFGRLMGRSDESLVRWKELERERRALKQTTEEEEPVVTHRMAENEAADDDDLLEDSLSPEQAIDAASKQGVPRAEMLYRNLAMQPTIGLCSFSPQEYVRQCGAVKEAQKEQGTRRSWMRFLSKRRMEAARVILQEMKKELRDLNIDPETGDSLTDKPARKKRKISR